MHLASLRVVPVAAYFIRSTMAINVEEAHRSRSSSKELTADVKRAIREITMRMDQTLKFESPEEISVVNANFAIVKQRLVAGLAAGGAVSALAWKLAVGRKNLPLVAASGAFIGMTYGTFSVREDFFLDMLSIPPEKSRFADEGRKMLQRELPSTSPLFEEVKRRERILFPPPTNSSDAFEWSDQSSWNAPPALSTRKPQPPREDEPPFATQEDDAKPVGGWFSFGSSAPGKEVDRNSDGQWIDDDADQQNKQPKKATTWEEIRRRAG